VHTANVWHRDIKPDNILVRSDGSPVLIDFGAAHKDAVNGALSMMAIYSPSYAAPEQVFRVGQQGPWTDIYSLAATLYTMVVGSPPTNATERFQHIPYLALVEREPTGYTLPFLHAIDEALAFTVEDRPRDTVEWRELFVGTNTPVKRRADDATILHETIQSPQKRFPDISVHGSAEGMEPTPRPTGQSPSRPAKRANNRRGPLLAAALGVIVLGVAGIWIFLEEPFQPRTPGTDDVVIADKISKHVDGTESSPAAPTQLPNPELIIPQLDALIRLIDCATVSATVGDDLAIMLDGYIASDHDTERLLSGIRDIEGVNRVVNRTRVIGSPFCEIVGMLAPYYNPEPDAVHSVRIDLAEETLKDGDPFVVQTTASDGYGGYLYLDYVDSESQVIHLLPTDPSKDRPVKAGQRIVLGEDEGWVASPPHGLNMLIAIHAHKSLFESQRNKDSSLTQYLHDIAAALRTARATDASSKVSVTFKFFTTHQ
jgi:hypothetical protein